MTKQKDNRPIRRSSEGMRWLSIGTRTAHIAVAGVVFGGVMLQTSHDRLVLWHWLTIASGVLMLLLEWQHDPNWPHRAKGLLVHLHLLMGLLIHVASGFGIFLLWGVVISGSIGSHMPRNYRHWSFLYGPEKREGKRAGTVG